MKISIFNNYSYSLIDNGYVSLYWYDADGNRTVKEHLGGEAVLVNGKELDNETGLYYYGARYYDPKISVWYSTDPMEMDYPWVTTYGYCLGNPIKFVDNFGNEPERPYVGFLSDFIKILNNSPRKVGHYKYSQAANYLRNLGNTEWNWKQLRPIPTETGYFNKKRGRYIYRKSRMVRHGSFHVLCRKSL